MPSGKRVPKDKKAKSGRPFVFTEEKKAQVLQWVGEFCVSRNDCCKRLGISPDTFYAELNADKDYSDRLTEAENYARDKYLGAINKHSADKDWRAAQFMLERKWYKEFAKRDTFTKDDLIAYILRLSDLVTKYVPEDTQLDFAQEVDSLLKEIAKAKKKENK